MNATMCPRLIYPHILLHTLLSTCTSTPQHCITTQQSHVLKQNNHLTEEENTNATHISAMIWNHKVLKQPRSPRLRLENFMPLTTSHLIIEPKASLVAHYSRTRTNVLYNKTKTGISDFELFIKLHRRVERWVVLV